MKKLARIAAVITAMLVMLTTAAFAAEGDSLGKNGEAAKEMYGISDSNVVTVSENADSEEINSALSEALEKAGTKVSAMVYVPDGDHELSAILKVPTGVVLVSEENAEYSGNTGEKMMVAISGSVYGGVFDGKDADTICWLNYVKFSNNNGEVRNAVLKNAKIDAIHYGSSVNKTKLGGAKAVGNTISNCKSNGITAMNGGSFDLISKNKISKVGTGSTGSGLSITHANVAEISNNTISNIKGHGISTDTDFKGMQQAKITIKTISGNKITKAGVHGIWVDKKVTIKKVNKNIIKNSKNCGIAIEKNGRIEAMNNNTIQSSNKSNVTMNGKGSYLVVGSKNTITKSKSIGIMANGKATLKITGKGNVIKSNKTNDVRVLKSKGAKFTFKNKKKNTIDNLRVV